MKHIPVLLLSVLPAYALADSPSSQDLARDAVARGEILSLALLLPRIETEFDGRVLDVELEKENGVLVYEMDILTRALVVEDDGRIAADLSATLAAAGFRVDRVGDGRTAWFQGGTEPYDLIVLDLGLPQLDGLTVLKRWRSEGVETPVLVLTARGAWTERVEGIDAGADDYLPKPFRMEELVAGGHRCRWWVICHLT